MSLPSKIYKQYTVLPFYDDIQKQNRYNLLCQSICDFKLLSQCDDVPPFELKLDLFGNLQRWYLKYLDGEILVPSTTPSIDPYTTWDIQHISGAGSINITTINYVIGTADWTTDLNTTMAILVNSINTNTSLGTQFVGRPFSNAEGFTAYWNIGEQKLYVYTPEGSGSLYNGELIQAAINSGTWGGEAGNINSFSGGVDAVTTYSYSDTIDITDCGEFLNKYVKTNYTYLVYNGGSIASCMPTQMECGRWYVEIADESNTYYSEVFYVEPIEITEPTDFIPIKNIWTWYDNELKQNRYKSICSAVCDFNLITPCDKLLPFIVKLLPSLVPLQTIVSWTLENIDDGSLISLDISLLSIVDGYIIYRGDQIENLVCGVFQSIIEDNDGNILYSEIITIVNEVLFVSESDGLQTDSGIDILTDSGIQITID